MKIYYDFILVATAALLMGSGLRAMEVEGRGSLEMEEAARDPYYYLSFLPSDIIFKSIFPKISLDERKKMLNILISDRGETPEILGQKAHLNEIDKDLEMITDIKIFYKRIEFIKGLKEKYEKIDPFVANILESEEKRAKELDIIYGKQQKPMRIPQFRKR